MKHFRLSRPELDGGFTDAFLVTVDDITESGTNTDQPITLDALAQGDVVHEVLIDRKVAATGLTACNVSVGVTGALTTFTANSSMLAAGEPTVGNNDQQYVTPSGGKNLILNVDPASNGENLASLTAFEVVVYAKITRRADRLTRRQF